MSELTITMKSKTSPSGAAPDSALASGDGWQSVFDDFARWAQNPEDLADEGITAPTAQIIFRANTVARQLKALGLPRPAYVVPSGDGGFIFEWRVGRDHATTIEVMPDQRQEVSHFVRNELKSRGPWPNE